VQRWSAKSGGRRGLALRYAAETADTNVRFENFHTILVRLQVHEGAIQIAGNGAFEF
jgi:hypothetical protein